MDTEAITQPPKSESILLAKNPQQADEPGGLQCLDNLDQVLIDIRRETETQLFAPWKVTDIAGKLLFKVTVRSASACGEGEYVAQDAEERDIFLLNHSICCCIFCIFYGGSKVQLQLPPGEQAGAIQMRCCLINGYNIKDRNGRCVFQIKNLLSTRIVNDWAVLPIYTNNGKEVGKIEWKQAMHFHWQAPAECRITFPPDIEVNMKVALIGVCSYLYKMNPGGNRMHS